MGLKISQEFFCKSQIDLNGVTLMMCYVQFESKFSVLCMWGKESKLYQRCEGIPILQNICYKTCNYTEYIMFVFALWHSEETSLGYALTLQI